MIALPHITNFDDFDTLEREPGVRLRYVEVADELGAPDLIILPGTKSTVADLVHLRNTGRDQEIIRQVCRGTPIIGICGGYQMLGKAIHDPDGIEAAESITTGLSLLPVTSRFLRRNRLIRFVRAWRRAAASLHAPRELRSVATKFTWDWDKRKARISLNPLS